MVKTIFLILFIAHLVGCNSAMIGYLIGTASNLTSDVIIRQLQTHKAHNKEKAHTAHNKEQKEK